MDVEVRLIGSAIDVGRAVVAIENRFTVAATSPAYPVRHGDPTRVRVYLRITGTR